MSLRGKLFIFAFLICTVPLLLLGYFWFNTSEKALTESTYRELDSINLLSSNLVREWTSGSATLLESLAQRPLVIVGIQTFLAKEDTLALETRKLLDNHFLPALQMQSDLKSLSILDMKGLVRVSSDPRLVGRVHDREDFFIRGKTASFIGNVVQSTAIGEPVMHVATPIKSNTGQTIAVLSGHLNWERASELLSMPVTGSPTLESYLVNRSSIMLTDSKFVPDAPLRVKVDTVGLKNCFEKGNGYGVYPDYRGVNVFGVYTWLPERDVCLLTEKDITELAAPLQQLKSRFYAVTLLLGGLAVLIALAITRTITGPIRQLADDVRSSGSGNGQAPLPVSQNELGQIARAFNENQTARRTAEQEIRRLIDILEHAPQLVAIADPDGRISYLNNAGKQWIGLKTDRAPNLKMTDLQPQWVNHFIRKQALTTAAESGFWSGETAFLGPDAREIPAMQVVMAHQHPDGGISHYSTIAFDLTERKQLEEELHRHQRQLEELVDDRTRALLSSETKFRAYFEYAPIGMAITSLDKNWDETNDRLCEIFGYSREELNKKTWEELTYPQDLAVDLVEFDKLLAGAKDSYSLEKRFIRKDGQIIHTMLSVACVRKEDGSPDYFAATIQDISQRKQAEIRLEEAMQVLESSNRELEQFAYVASHDLQEPLRTVTSYLQLLERRYREQFDDDAREFIDYTVEAAARMKTLINDLLEFSRIGRKESTTEDVDLNQVIDQIVSQNRLVIEETETEIRVDELPTIRGIRSQLNQLFQNLLGNAIKFRRKETPPIIRISATESGNHWEICLKDNGIGIEDQYFDKIFTIFQRLHTMKEYPGTGIGLALCKKIVERHNGTIELKSIPGEGTTFFIRLPKEEQHGETQRPTD